MTNTSTMTKLSLDRNLKWAMTDYLYLMTGLIFLLFSFWDGLFFDKSFSAATIYIAVLFIVFLTWMASSGITVQGWSVVDYLILAYCGCYLLSSFNPADVQYAVLGLVRCFAYFLLYLLVRILVSADDKKQFLLNVLILSGFLFGIYGLANGFGTLHDSASIFDPRERRLASVFQYSNTFAIYQAVMLLLSMTMSVLSSASWKLKWFYAVCNYILITSVILTYSRGTWLVLIGMVLLQIMIAPKQYRMETVFSFLVPVLVMLVTMNFLAKATLLQKQGQGWGAMLAGLLLVTLFVWIRSRLVIRITLSTQQLKRSMYGLGIVMLIGIGTVIAKVGLPQNVVQRFASINMQQFSVVQRFLFYRDGLKILTEHPILGGAANSWLALHQRYQSYPYISRQSHSFFIDNLMDIGVLGTIVFLLLLIMIIWQGIRVLRTLEGEKRFYQATFFTSFLALVVHGAIDFDFSYGSINFLMWTLIALLLPKLTVKVPSLVSVDRSKPKFQKWMVAVSWVVLLFSGIVSGGYLISDHYVSLANDHKKDAQVGLDAMKIATDLAPYSAPLWLTRAQFEEVIFAQTDGLRDKNNLLNSIQTAVAVAPHDAATLDNAARQIGKYGDGLQAISLARQAWENAPYEIQHPELYLTYTEMAGTQYYKADQNKAKTYFDQTLLTYHDVEQRIANFKNLPPVLKPEYPYDITPAMREYAAEAAYYEGQYGEVERILLPVSGANVKMSSQDQDHIHALLAVNAIKQNKPLDANLQKAIQQSKTASQLYSQLIGIAPIK